MNLSKYLAKCKHLVHANHIIGLKNLIFFLDKNRPSDVHYLFIDITELHHNDFCTGVQRVTKNILSCLYEEKLSYTIAQVYAKPRGSGFYYASDDKPVRFAKGDCFFGLDLSVYCIPANNLFLKKMKRFGVPVYFFIHDLIPIRFPETVEEGIRRKYPVWLKTIVSYDGVIANSKSTADDLVSWVNEHAPERKGKVLIEYSLLGTFIEKKEYPPMQHKNYSPVFLMVSTVEPRKKYDQAVGAITSLLNQGVQCKLIIVGKPGWNNETVISKINNNPYFGDTIVWFSSGISDEELSYLYRNCSAVLFTSVAEGFGLPIVEAASYDKPLILRDIPVFREIAGDGAFYFSTLSDEELAGILKDWISLFAQGKEPRPRVVPTTWKECTEKIITLLSLYKY